MTIVAFFHCNAALAQRCLLRPAPHPQLFQPASHEPRLRRSRHHRRCRVHSSPPSHWNRPAAGFFDRSRLRTGALPGPIMADMPGSFLSGDAPFRVSSQLFQPPRTPSASSSLFLSHDNASARKRLRRDGPEDRSFLDPVSSGELGSPAPLVNTDYRLAGGLEETRHLETDENQDAMEEELDYRPNRYRDPTVLQAREEHEENSYNDQNNGRGNRKRSHSVSEETNKAESPYRGWGRAVFNVVGKVWDFCWSSAFRGFYAGGGQSYRMTANSPPTLDQSSWQMVSRQDDVFGPDSQSPNPIPGDFPADEDEDYEKARDQDLRASWVLVPDGKQHLSSRSSSPTNTARRVPRRGSAWRAQPRRSTGMPRLSRRSVLNPTRTSMTISARPGTPTKSQFTPSRPSSKDSPASLEAQRLAAKVRRREREEDASIRRLNDQLKAMIREGREALGTRVEIDESIDLDDD
ncbi:hypothetical protein VTN96DRAFT_7990 [Rasamsonia emersonii]